MGWWTAGPKSGFPSRKEAVRDAPSAQREPSLPLRVLTDASPTTTASDSTVIGTGRGVTK